MNVVQEKKYLTVYWDRYSKNNFWYIWLYDNAPTNRHQNGQKLTSTYKIPADIQPKSVHWDTTHLYITWNKEPIAYPISWLKKSVPSESKSRGGNIGTNYSS